MTCPLRDMSVVRPLPHMSDVPIDARQGLNMLQTQNRLQVD